MNQEQDERGGSSGDGSGEELRRAFFERGRERWPGVQVSREQFEHHLVKAGCRSLCAADAAGLYLCAACALGVETGLRALERTYLCAIRGAVWRLLRDADSVDDVMQEIRYRLLVGPSARISTFGGRGSLTSWLRRVAIHAALDHKRAAVSGQLRWTDGVRELEAAAHRDAIVLCPEDGVLDRQCSARCEQVLRSVIGALESEDRQLLQYRFVSGFNIDAIGQVYAIDRATAARRIHRSVKRIRQKTHAKLSVYFRCRTPRELDELLRSVYRHLDTDSVRLGEQHVT